MVKQADVNPQTKEKQCEEQGHYLGQDDHRPWQLHTLRGRE
jgi:hypothetical protein